MNMKKIIINIVLAVTTVFALSACEDFLDTKNLTQKTTENFPETEKDAQEMVTAIYAHLLFESPETSSQFYVAQLAGDDCPLREPLVLRELCHELPLVQGQS